MSKASILRDRNFIEALLEIPEENQRIEFKLLEGSKVVSKITESVVAMANAEGGTIIIGIDDPEKTKFKGLNRVFGLQQNMDLYDELLRDLPRVVPPISNIANPLKFKIEIDDDVRTVAIISVPKATDSFHSIRNNVYIRLEKSIKRLSPQEVVKMSYAKGFEKADKELVDVDFALLQTNYYEDWKNSRGIPGKNIQEVLFKTGLARKDGKGKLLPTRAAVLLFAEYPTKLMDTKCAVRIFQHSGRMEEYRALPNYVSKPITIEGPLVELIAKSQEQVLTLLRAGIEMRSGFINKYRIPERAVREAITNAVIHRDYHIKKDIEIRIFEDRIEVRNPGLLPYNITRGNIGKVRADDYRNDLLVKHLRDFPQPPNLDQNEGVRAMQEEMQTHNLFPPIYWTYPLYEDAVEVGLINELRPNEWEKVSAYLSKDKYINNAQARRVTGVVQAYTMSALLRRWVNQGLLIKIQPKTGAKRNTRYKLANQEEINTH